MNLAKIFQKTKVYRYGTVEWKIGNPKLARMCVRTSRVEARFGNTWIPINSSWSTNFKERVKGKTSRLSKIKTNVHKFMNKIKR